MATKKMSLANVQGKLSRAEMKNVMAGDEGLGGYCGSQGTVSNCPYTYTAGQCDLNNRPYCKDENGNCYQIGTAVCTL